MNDEERKKLEEFKEIECEYKCGNCEMLQLCNEDAKEYAIKEGWY